ncbi:hypothetical protein VTK56DRAFT_6520 [Thermocarpiscus australiensis]
MSTMVLDSFSTTLPALPVRQGLSTTVSASGVSTADTTPPMLWLARPANDYTTKAHEALGTPTVHGAATQNHMPALEATFEVRCEADIHRAAALYLLHPAHVALTALYPNVRIRCFSEYTNNEKSRPDIVYEKDGRAFAIVEYKVPGVINSREFNNAKVPMNSSPEENHAPEAAR